MDMYIKTIIMNHPEGERGQEYPFSLPVVRNLDRLSLSSQVAFFVGENGMGKSTLLEAIAVAYGFNPEGGSKNFSFTTASTHSALHEHIVLAKGARRPKDGFFLRAESFYNVASEVDRLEEVKRGLLASYGGRSLHDQSHGESFMSLALNRFFGNGLYLLDEPEAALSPLRQMALLARMNDLVKENSQFLVATHSPILLSYPGAQIYVLSEEGIELVPYRETEHYRVTKQFLDNPEGMLRHLGID